MIRNMTWHPDCGKEKTMDSDRIYYSELKCYAEATEKQRKIGRFEKGITGICTVSWERGVLFNNPDG